MGMELVLQTTSETCGQACIAMITGKDIAISSYEMEKTEKQIGGTL